jgi:hypothetical protein
VPNLAAVAHRPEGVLNSVGGRATVLWPGSGRIGLEESQKKKKTVVEKRYRIQGKEISEELGTYLARNGQVLLPMVELIEQSPMGVDELIDVLGRLCCWPVFKL